ncbi:sensor histidine kinase KdpD [Chryseobacterium sp. WLY505]|uniref:sensor histidine kinase n=1 Tax=Chryseobacterium sp. WLY505 TaxID=3068892 RepID=UPI00279643F0|nr:HAMP domain-containing sensor histidine kinase [Chryseobacterium sp. WLY505]MDQ1856357.1 HAMP domain-containing sensor histidine kinase [Chryseobacterium sp. WLY505]
MKKKFRKVFLIVSITATSILVFQLYWVYNSYKTTEENVKNNIENILKKSIDIYELKQFDTLPVIKDDDSFLYYVTKKYPVRGSKKNFSIMQDIQIPENQLDNVKKILSQLISSNKSIDLKDLKKILKQELAKNNIPLDFDLTFSNNQTPLKETYYVPVPFSKKDLFIKIRVKNLDGYLFKHNLIPLLISMALIVLSGGSLYFMALTIKRQSKLDDVKNDFINNMTHELRTPICVLKSSNEALLNFNAINDVDKAKKYLTLNNDILNKLDQNVDRILDIVKYSDRSSSANLVEVHLNDLILTIVNRFTINEDIKIKYINTLKEDSFYTDPYIIHTVLSNLLDNAVKYAGTTEDILLEVSPDKNGIQFLVEDYGKGINSEYLPYIFDKFFRVPTGDLHDVKGYGLGLNFVKELVNTLNGEITVKSKLNLGTTFIIKFPHI